MSPSYHIMLNRIKRNFLGVNGILPLVVIGDMLTTLIVLLFLANGGGYELDTTCWKNKWIGKMEEVNDDGLFFRITKHIRYSLDKNTGMTSYTIELDIKLPAHQVRTSYTENDQVLVPPGTELILHKPCLDDGKPWGLNFYLETSTHYSTFAVVYMVLSTFLILIWSSLLITVCYVRLFSKPFCNTEIESDRHSD